MADVRRVGPGDGLPETEYEWEVYLGWAGGRRRARCGGRMEVKSEMWEMWGGVRGRRREHRGAGGLMDASNRIFCGSQIGWKGTVISEA